jgi:Family of unknown function (DUF6090)
MLLNGNTGRYLKYAIGEILLVVIGIVIALQINIANETRKSRNLEQDYYCRLLEDSNQDIARIQEYIKETKTRVHHGNLLLSMLQKGETSKKIIFNQNAASLARMAAIFHPNTSAFDDLKSSGNLNIIRDVSIKNTMNEYYVFLEGFIKVVELNSSAALNLIYEEDNYQEAGQAEWFYTDQAIDTTLVNKAILNQEKNLSKAYIKKYVSNQLFIIGMNNRNLDRYQIMQEEILRVNKLLLKKCN